MSTQRAQAIDFHVERVKLPSCRFRCGPVPEPAAGQALLRVDAFAFTANNVTYAVAGDMMSYWDFFPAEPGWGRVPVWGFGDVIASRCEDVKEGSRVFGYLPMSTHLLVEPDRIANGSFVDGSEHRRALPPVYNQYISTAQDPGYSAAHEDEQMLLRPLFMTAFMLDDFLAADAFFGARAVVLSSASSKTAFGLAFLLHKRAGVEVIGLTSAGNVAFVEGLGCYDRVVTYDRVASLPADLPAAFVDMAGNGAVVSAVHHHFRDNLKHSAIVGLTHWGQRASADDLPGAAPALFFAPTQIQKRSREWGPEGLQQRYGAAWTDFLGFTQKRLRVVHGRGEADVERVYLETLAGKVSPDEGHILSLW